MRVTLPLLALLLLLGGCATTPAERIAEHRADFDAWPPDVQARIRNGEIAPGFTPEQVQLALGAPDRTFSRLTSDRGEESVWIYHNHRPQISIGLGVVSGGRSGFVSGATVFSTRGLAPDEVLRVTFAGGRVVMVERAR